MVKFARDDAVNALTDPKFREPLAWAIAIENGIDPIKEALRDELWWYGSSKVYPDLGNIWWILVQRWDPKYEQVHVQPASKPTWAGFYAIKEHARHIEIHAIKPTWNDVIKLRATK